MDYNQYMQGFMPPRARKDLPQDMQDRLNKIPWTPNPSRSFFNVSPMDNFKINNLSPPQRGGKLPVALSGEDYFNLQNWINQNNKKPKSIKNSDGSFTLENGMTVDKETMMYLSWNDMIDRTIGFFN